MLVAGAMLVHGMFGERGWLAGARAKHASLQSTADCMALFAAYADADAVPDMAAQLPLVTGASQWVATDGFKDANFISFADESYAAMRDDESRTPFFAEAILARLAEAPPNTLAVLDIGTGPHAVLALLAAKAGARKVYAVEANAEAAQRARAFVAQEGWADVVEVIDGFSTSLALPELVDVCVSEIVGSIASEEGLYATIRDAHARLVKEPRRPDSWIPHTVETWGVPCSYALHYALGASAYDWSRVGEPLRLSCEDGTLLPLHSTACRLESIAFTDPCLPSAACPPPVVESTFVIEPQQLRANERSYYAALRAAGVEAGAARRHAVRAARSMSGLAMWCRLELRQAKPAAQADEGAGQPEGTPEIEGDCGRLWEGAPEIVVETRGAGAGGASGAPGPSCWQTVLPLMAARPVTVGAGSVVRATATMQVPDAVEDPLRYSVDVRVSSEAEPDGADGGRGSN